MLEFFSQVIVFELKTYAPTPVCVIVADDFESSHFGCMFDVQPAAGACHHNRLMRIIRNVCETSAGNFDKSTI